MADTQIEKEGLELAYSRSAKSSSIIQAILSENGGQALAREIANAIASADEKKAKIFRDAFKRSLYFGFLLDSSMSDTKMIETLTGNFDQFKNLAVEKTTLEIWKYDNNKWQHIDVSELKSWIVDVAKEETQDGISSGKVNSLHQMFQSYLAIKPERRAGLIAFRNGVLDLINKKFYKHDMRLGIQSVIDADYDPNDRHCPTFKRFMEHCANGCKERLNALYASVYYIVGCRFDKKMFVEYTGKSDTGKSTLVNILIAIVGAENHASLNLEALDGKNKEAHALESIVNASFITYPETGKMCGEFENLKAMTGLDEVRINPKNKKAYSAKIHAAHCVVGNNPLAIPETTSANFLRRVLIYFDNVVTKPDRNIEQKILSEVSGIVNFLMHEMTEEKFNEVLYNCRHSKDKLKVMEETDAIYSWAEHCLFVTKDETDFAPYGNDYNLKEDYKKRLLATRNELYPNYVLYCEFIGVKKISRRVFPKVVEALFETKRKDAIGLVKRKRSKQGGRDLIGLCNLKINHNADHIDKYIELHN